MKSLLLTTALLLSALFAPHRSLAEPVSTVDPVVPYMYRMGAVAESVSDLKQIRSRTGLHRFYLCGPGLTTVGCGPFAPDLYARMGAEMAEVKRQLAGTDIEVGWWCSTSIRYWSNLPKVEDAWGNKSADHKHCPLAAEFQSDWTAKIKSVVSALRPKMICIEDDYTMAWGRGLKDRPCYCPRHLAAFAARTGKKLKGPEIAAAFSNPTAENLAIRRAFSETVGDSLVELAKKVRAAVDEIDPAIRICLCEPGGFEKSGDNLEAVARAFAGGTRPAVRPCGAIYGAQTTPSDVPAAIGHTLFTLERLPRDIETFYEADPYPHNRFFSSAAQMQSLMAGAMFMGSQNLQLYCLQYLDDPLEDSGYADAFNAMKPRLAAVRDFISRGSRLAGACLVWRSSEMAWKANGSNAPLPEGAFLLAKMGIPYTSRPEAEGLSLLMGEVVDSLSDVEIRRLLSGGVLMDAPAAALLAQRGFGEFLGADATLAPGRLPIVGETLLPAAGLKRPGKTVNAFYIYNAGTEGTVSTFAILKPHPGTEVWSEFSGIDGKVITPSLTVGRNALGGRVAILATSLIGNRSSGLYNLRKQELLHNLFERLAPGAIPVAAVDTPGIWTLANVAADGKSMLVMVNNLSGDVREGQALAFGAPWTGAAVSRLGRDGKPIPLGATAARWRIPFALAQMEPEYLLVERRAEKTDPSVSVDATKPGPALPNTSQVLTFWNGVMNQERTFFAWPKKEDLQHPIGFARYAELMACTGGNKSRDLFKNPDDRTVLDDYDFGPLVAACRGILGIGMKPYLKLGNVPAKFSADYDGGEFSMNIRPPTDDLVHYRYMRACAAALKAAFGRDEVRTWRFAVLTEADNTGWFQTKSKSKEDARAAFFRLYDHAARAFEEELGPNLVFGAHMLYPGDPNCPQTQFSVEEVVAHCVGGTNAATGKIGAPLRLLTASYYGRPDRDDLSQGRCVNLRRIRTALDKAGLKDVVTGVDEGRVIVAAPGRERKDLNSRAVGASYQAAFDVRVMKEIFDDRMDYFASWGYFSGPRIHFEGVPSHHYFSSREFAKFAGLGRAPVTVSGPMPSKEELDAIAGVSADGRTVRTVVGRFRDKLVFTNQLETTVKFQLPKDWAGKRVRASVLTLDDRNNWFVDWERDRAQRGITARDYCWSPDDFAVLAARNLQGEKFRSMFATELQPRYAKKADAIRPVESVRTVSPDATLAIPLDFVGNGAVFIRLDRSADGAFDTIAHK